MTFALHFSGLGIYAQQTRAREHLEALGESSPAQRVRALAILIASLIITEPEEARTLADECEETAQRAGDRPSRAWAHIARAVSDLSCHTTERRRELMGEALDIAEHTGERALVPTAYFLYLSALVELGELGEFERALSPMGPELSRFPFLAQGRHVAWFRCLQATLNGDITYAEQRANEAYALAQASSDPDAEAVYVGQLGIIRWAQGRAVELEPMFLRARRHAPHEPVWGAALAWIWLKQGRRSAARALLTSLPPVAELPVDRNWLSTACILAEVTSELEHRQIAADLYAVLRPFSQRLVTIGLGVTCWGTVARALGRLALVLEDRDAAIAHYREAIEVAGRAQAHPWLAEVQWELAELLAPEDARRQDALDLAVEAVATARALHLPGIEEKASAVLASLRAPEVAHVPAVAKPRITVLGGFEVVSTEGHHAKWTSRKARQLLKILASRQGAAMSKETLMDELWPGVAADLLANRFSVAASAVRRALDPAGSYPRDAFLVYHDGLMRLRTEELDVDVEHFLLAAETALAENPHSAQQLKHALSLYTGEPFAEEQEEAWATEFRRQVHLAFFAVSHALATCEELVGEPLVRLETYRRILALDEFDQRAHLGVINALEDLGSYGQAKAAMLEYLERMQELGISDLDTTRGVDV